MAILQKISRCKSYLAAARILVLIQLQVPQPNPAYVKRALMDEVRPFLALTVGD
jgi:hypothetical protein